MATSDEGQAPQRIDGGSYLGKHQNSAFLASLKPYVVSIGIEIWSSASRVGSKEHGIFAWLF